MTDRSGGSRPGSLANMSSGSGWSRGWVGTWEGVCSPDFERERKNRHVLSAPPSIPGPVPASCLEQRRDAPTARHTHKDTGQHVEGGEAGGREGAGLGGLGSGHPSPALPACQRQMKFLTLTHTHPPHERFSSLKCFKTKNTLQ